MLRVTISHLARGLVHHPTEVQSCCLHVSGFKICSPHVTQEYLGASKRENDPF